MASLIDVNVLVALMHGKHAHHARALRWLAKQTEPAGICRIVQMGTLRLMSRAAVMGSDVISAGEFWAAWESLMADDRFTFVKEAAGLEADWSRLTLRLPKGQCAETDAYLAAFAKSADFRLVTFDQEFRRFTGVKLEVLR